MIWPGLSREYDPRILATPHVSAQLQDGATGAAPRSQTSTATRTSIRFATSAYRSTSTSGARMPMTSVYRTARS